MFIASAFAKSDAYQRYLQGVDSVTPEKILIVRWRAEDLVYGASDVDLYEIASAAGWQFFVNHALHAKLFVFDEDAVIGSANLTHRGMWGLPPEGNQELGTRVAVSNELEGWMRDVVQSSRLVDDELYKAIKAEAESMRGEVRVDEQARMRFSDQVLAKLSSPQSITLYTQDLFWSESPGSLLVGAKRGVRDRDVEHDFMLLRIQPTSDYSELREGLIQSLAFRWLRAAVNEEAYFGALTAALHSSLLDDPTPLRKDVKSLLATLLRWVEELTPDFFQVDKPRTSTRVRKIGWE